MRDVTPRHGTRAALSTPALQVETAVSITVFDPQDWDRLLAPADYFRHGYLAALEASGLDCGFHYAVARQGETLVGLGFGCLTRFNFGRWRPGVWLAGSPVNLGCPFAFAPGWNTPDVRHRLQVALFEQARAAGALYFLLRDLTAADAAATAPPLQLLPMALHCTALLPLPYADFDAYLASLKGSRRKSARRDLRSIEDAGFRLTTEPPPAELAPRLLALWLPLYEKYRDPDQIRLSEGYFRAMASRPEAVFLLLWRGDALVAFDLCLRSGPLLSSVFSGVDPAASADFAIHRYMGYAIIQRAIELGCSTIDFGISNEEAKQRLGCRLEMLHGSGRPVPPLLHAAGAGRLVKKLFGSPTDAPPAAPADADTVAPPVPTAPLPPAAPAVSRQRRRAVVIGAGLGGLAAATRLAADPRLEVLLLERGSEVGGVCRLARFEGPGRQFVGGCNLFSPRFFALLRSEFGIRLPAQPVRSRIYHRGRPVNAARLAGPGQLLAGLALLGGALRGSTLAEAAGAARRGSALLADLATLPFMLQGQDPRYWTATTGLARLLRTDASHYPTPGLPAVPQALQRVFTQRGGSLRLSTAVEGLACSSGRVIGVHTSEGDVAADLVLSSLPPTAHHAWLPGHLAPARPTGLAAMAVFLVLDAAFPLPAGHHGLVFMNDDLPQQLRQLFDGHLPGQPGFDLVSPDLAAARPGPEGWRITVFSTCPAMAKDIMAAEKQWARLLPQLEAAFPGFAAAIRWCRVVSPGEYPETVGCTSQLSPFADAPPNSAAAAALPAGFHLAGGSRGAVVGDTFAALRQGSVTAEHILRTWETAHG